MSGNIDILVRLPEVAAIGRSQLQAYCNQWIERPIARDYAISHLIVGSNLMLTANLDPGRAQIVDNRTFIPICELLDYIIDEHFAELAKRRELHAEVHDIKKQWGEIGYQYEAMSAPVGNLWLKCKNPNCDVSMETAQQAVAGQRIHCPPRQVICPICGHVDWYDGSDLHVRIPLQ